MGKFFRLVVMAYCLSQTSVFSAEERFSRSTAAWLSETEPGAVIKGVHLLSGHYCFREVDYVVPGPNPILVERFYNPNSGTVDGFRYFDWYHLSWYRTGFDHAIGERHGSLVLACEPSGSGFIYRIQENGNDIKNNHLALEFFRERNCSGLTNTGAGGISGQHSLIHRTMHKKRKLFRVNLPDGTAREFMAWAHFRGNHLTSDGDRLDHPMPELRKMSFTDIKKPQKLTIFNFLSDIPTHYEPILRKDMYHHEHYFPPRFEKECNYCLERINHPNGNATLFRYSNEMEVTKISACGGQSKELASLSLRHGYWTGRPTRLGRKKLEILTSDGKRFTYHVRQDRNKPMFDYAEGPGLISKKYEYIWIGEKALIKKISAPEGRVKEFEFYPSDHPSAGKIKALKEPAGVDGALVPTLRVNYKTPYEAVAWDGRGTKSNYRFSKEFRIEEVVRFNGGDKECSEAFEWGGEGNTQLIYKAVKDKKGQVLSAKYFKYDWDGNVLEEKNYGNFAGGHKRSISLEKGRERGGDVYKLKRTYQITHGGERKFNLLASEEDGVSLKHTFSYKVDTNLLTTDLKWDKDRLVRRRLYAYDEDGVCIRETIDDAHVNGEAFSERHETHIKPRQKQPGLGMPEVVRMTVTTPFGGERLKLMKKITYGEWHKPVKEEVFGSDGELAYTLSYTFDEAGNLSSKTDALGNTTAYAYDANKNLIREALPLEGYVRHYRYDKMNRLVTAIHEAPEGSYKTQYTYDVNGNKTSVTDHQGFVTRFEYDGLNRLIKKRSPPVINAEGIQENPVEEYTYNVFGQVISIKHPDGTRTDKKYNTYGKPTYISHPDGTEEYFTYRLDGEKLSHTNALGVKTTFKYDVFGNVIASEQKDPKGVVFAKTSSVHTAFHCTSLTDAESNKTSYVYNGLGQLLREEKEGTEGYIEYAYDVLGKQVRMCHYASGELQYAECKEYDLCGREISSWIEQPDGSRQCKQDISYDPLGRVVATTTYGQSGSEITCTQYDGLGRPIKVTDPAGATVTYRYEVVDLPEGRFSKLVTVNPVGTEEAILKDGNGHLYQVNKRDPSGKLLTSSRRYYDRAGRVMLCLQDSLCDKEDYRVSQEYNSLGQLVAMIEAPGTRYARKTAFAYNAQGLLFRKVKPDDVALNYTYDALGRLSSLKTTHGIHYYYAYDKLHRLTHVRDGSGSILLSREYNSEGRVTKDSYAACGLVTVKHDFDSCGRQVASTLPDNSQISYTYDGQLLKSSNYKGRTTSIVDRDASNRILRTELSSGMQVKRAYDVCSRLTHIQAPHFSQEIGYDIAGRLVHQKTKGPVGLEEMHYEYDFLDQLLSEEGENAQSYAYDALGNRVQHNEDVISYNPLNQIEPAPHLETTYNGRGHLLQKKTADEDLTFKYDDLDRLIQVRSEKFAYFFTYDPLGRRVTEELRGSLGSHCRAFIYDGECEIGAMERENDEGWRIVQLRVPLESVEAEIGGSHLFYLEGEFYHPAYDHRGNIVVLVDEKRSEPIFAYKYTGYGERQAWRVRGGALGYIFGNFRDEDSDYCPWHFSSKRSLMYTSLTHFGKRDYDATLGRWLVPDPSGFDDGLNLYVYVHNSPMVHFDPWGLSSESLSFDFQFPEVSAEGYRDYLRFKNEPSSQMGGFFSQNFQSPDWGDSKVAASNQFSFGKPLHSPPAIINGINTNRRETLQYVDHWSQVTGRQFIDLYNPTHCSEPTYLRRILTGYALDAIEFGQDLFQAALGRHINLDTEAVRKIDAHIMHWHGLLSRGAAIPIFGHSGGVIELRNALLRIKARESNYREILDRVHIFAVGPGTFIERELCGFIRHYMSKIDPVPHTALFSMQRAKKEGTVVSSWPASFRVWDHGFLSDTHQKEIHRDIKDFMERYDEYR